VIVHTNLQSPPAAPGGKVRRGLSLLEVLVALAIFLISLVALGQLVDLGSRAAREVQWLGQASVIAQSRMAEVIAGVLPLTSQGETGCEEDPDWNWSMDAQAGSAPGLFQVRVVVSRQRPDGSKFETVLNQMVLDPTFRGNTDGSTTGTDDTSTGTTGTSGTAGGSATTGGN
jgi:type II secretion system protein I